MVNHNISENIEEYLEVLYRHGNNREQVSTTTFSKELDIAPASVTQMLKKLEKLGYIKYIPYKGASLTDNGMKIAQEITRKHRILEIILADILKIKKENIHEQACEMEHALSDEALRALCLMLDSPDVSYLSTMIPACDLNFSSCLECAKVKDFDEIEYRKKNLLAISELDGITKGVISFIRGNKKLFDEISELGITIGTKICSRNVDNKIQLIFNGKEIVISDKIANNIFIEI